MLKLGKLTDYAVIVLGALDAGSNNEVSSSTDISSRTQLPEPTVAKILKLLSKGELVLSTRGAQGGYRLSRPLEQIFVSDIVAVMEGGFALTSCVEHESCCSLQTHCPMKSGWDELNGEVLAVLKSFSVKRLLKAQPLKAIKQAV